MRRFQPISLGTAMEERSTRYWIGVASRDHVLRGVSGGFCQLAHGKAAPVKRMQPGDWLVYYSGKLRYGEDAPCQRFTAIGRIAAREPYPFPMEEGFTPMRRDAEWLPAQEAEIAPLLPELTFIPDKKRWGYPFRFGHLEIPRADFLRIAEAMLGPQAQGLMLGLKPHGPH